MMPLRGMGGMGVEPAADRPSPPTVFIQIRYKSSRCEGVGGNSISPGSCTTRISLNGQLHH